MESRSNRLSYASSTSSSFSYFSGSTTLFDNEAFCPTNAIFPGHSTFSSESTGSSLSDTLSITTTRSYDSITKSWFPHGILTKVVKGLGTSAVELVSEYAFRKRLTTISSRIDSGKDKIRTLSDSDIGELQDFYEDLLERDYRGEKFQLTALKLRLSIVQILVDSETKDLFSRMRKTTFQKIWQDLDRQTPHNGNDASQVHQQAYELKQRLVLKVVDEMCSKEPSPSDTVIDGYTITKILCKELAYSSGEYTTQRALERLAQTEWGFQMLIRLESKEELVNGKPDTSVFDCVSRLLSFDNVFSCTMAIRIFGRLAQQNEEIYSLLAGPSGLGWLVERLGELTYSKIYVKQLRWRGRSARAVEAYCNALLAACLSGFTDQVIQLGTPILLLRLIKIFTLRDKNPKIHSQIEENQHEDLDIERDQIACCELIYHLLGTPLAKRKLLLGTRLLQSFNAHSNRLFSDHKLLTKLADILKQLEVS